MVKIVKCNFLSEKKECYAEITKAEELWKVDDITLKKFCTSEDFASCPRLGTFLKFTQKT